MAEEKETTVNFKTSSLNSRKFNAEVKLRGLRNKEMFNRFLETFLAQPEATLKFIGIEG